MVDQVRAGMNWEPPIEMPIWRWEIPGRFPHRRLEIGGAAWSGSEQFSADIFQNVDSALDTDFAGKDGVFVFDAEDALKADVHVSLDDLLPEVGAVAVADGAEGLGSGIEIAFFESKVENAVLVDVFRIEGGVFHVRVVNGALFSEEVNDFDGIAALPEEVAEIAVGADFFAGSFAELQQSARIVNDEVGVHLEREPMHTVFAGVFGGVFPVGDDAFFPLPVLHLGVFGRPAVSDPVGLRVGGRTAGTAGETDDDFDFQHFREENSLAERVDVFLGVFCVGMNRVAVAAESGYANVLVFKFPEPGFGFGAVGDQFVERAVFVVGVAAGADFHGFEAEGGDFFEHFVDGEMVVDGIEDADGDFAEGTCGGWGFGLHAGACERGKIGGRRGVGCVRQRASDEGGAGGGEELTAIDGEFARRVGHSGVSGIRRNYTPRRGGEG